jgi:hypothetical protein
VKRVDAQWVRERLFGLILEEGDEIVAVLGLLETAERHLGTGNVLFGVLEVLELYQVSLSTINEGWVKPYQSVLVPVHGSLLVGIGI